MAEMFALELRMLAISSGLHVSRMDVTCSRDAKNATLPLTTARRTRPTAFPTDLTDGPPAKGGS